MNASQLLCKLLSRNTGYLLSLSLWHTCTCAQTIHNTNDIVQLVAKQNPSVHIAHINRRIQQYDLAVAEAEFSPKLTLTASAEKSYTNDAGSHTDEEAYAITPNVSLKSHYGTSLNLAWRNTISNIRTHDNFSDTDGAEAFNSIPTLTLTQPLLKGFGPDIQTDNLKTARENETNNQLALKRTLIDQITQGITNYYQVLKTQQSVKIQSLALKRSQQWHERTKTLVKEGKLARKELLSIESQLANEALAITQLELTLNTQKQQLADLLGLAHLGAFNMPKQLHRTQQLTPELSQSVIQALRNDLSYQQQHTRVAQTARDVQIAKDAQRWTLNLRLEEQLIGGQTTDNYANAVGGLSHLRHAKTTVGLNVEVPIGSDIDRKRSLIAAEVALDAAQVQEANIKRTLHNHVAHDIQALALSKQSHQRAQLALKNKQLELENAQVQFEEGLISAYQLSEVKNDLTQAEIDQISSKLDYYAAITRFDSLVGTTLTTWDLSLD